MARYSVTYREGETIKTIGFEHEMALTRLLADMNERGALIVPVGASLDGKASVGRRAVLISNIISVQDDPA